MARTPSVFRSRIRNWREYIIMVTHDQRATRYVDQIFHLEKGVLVDAPVEVALGAAG